MLGEVRNRICMREAYAFDKSLNIVVLGKGRLYDGHNTIVPLAIIFL